MAVDRMRVRVVFSFELGAVAKRSNKDRAVALLLRSEGDGSERSREVVTVNVCAIVVYIVLKAVVGQEEIVSLSISEFAVVVKPTFWTGLMGSCDIVVVLFEPDVLLFGGSFNNSEFAGNTTMECTLDRSETKMPACEDDPVCLLNLDEVGLITMGWIEIGGSDVAAASEAKAEVDRILTDGVGISTSVALKVRESVVEIVEVRVRVNSTTDVVDTWFLEIFTATTAADMTVVAVEGEEDIVGKVENRVPKAVKVEVTTTAAAKLCPDFDVAAWTPRRDPSRAIVDARIWKTVDDFMTF